MLTNLIKIKDVTHGSFHTDGKKLYVEGNNKYGSLGTGTHIICNMVQIKSIQDVSNIAEIIEFDEFSTFILTKDGNLYISGKFNASNIFRKYNIRGIKNITHDCKYILTCSAIYKLSDDRTEYNLLQVISNSITKIETCDNIIYILTRFGQLSFKNEILLNECIDICYNKGFLYVLTQNNVYMITDDDIRDEKPTCYKLSDIHHINDYVCTPIKIHVIHGMLYIIYDDGIEIIDKDKHEFISISKDLKKYTYCNDDSLVICTLLDNGCFVKLYSNKDNVKDKKEQQMPKDIKCIEVKSGDKTIATFPMEIANVKHGTFYTDGKSLFVTGDNSYGCLGAGHNGMCNYTKISIYDKVFNIKEVQSIYEWDEYTTVMKMKNGTTLVTGKLNNSYIFKSHELNIDECCNNITQTINELDMLLQEQASSLVKEFNEDVKKIKRDSMLKQIDINTKEHDEKMRKFFNNNNKVELKLQIECIKEKENNILVYHNIVNDNKHLFTFHNKSKDCTTTITVNRNISRIIGHNDEYIAFIENDENILYINILKEEMYYLYKGNCKILDAVIAPDNCIVLLLNNNSLMTLCIDDIIMPKSAILDINNVDIENINIEGDNYNIKLI